MIFRHHSLKSSPIATAGLTVGILAATAATAWANPQIAPHRAVYNLELSDVSDGSALTALQGRLVVEILGSQCEGWSLNTRYVFRTEGEGGYSVLSDVRAAQWEDADGSTFRFVSRRYDNERLSEVTDGTASRADNGIEVALDEPAEATFEIDGSVLFPTQHLRRVLEAAGMGQPIVSARIYDGSDEGDQVYSTLTVIGGDVAASTSDPDAPGGDVLSDLDAWRVTVSYFEESYTPSDDDSGEQMPVYTIAYDLFANGVSRTLDLDYGDFKLAGDLQSIEFLEESACE
ncbi:MAG: cell envelope integrity EipB family protein [Pseudomonadota bacterium]